jgi:catechol 2,3-dioxygenase-like lactoylglutathione lyase family enzyme
MKRSKGLITVVCFLLSISLGYSQDDPPEALKTKVVTQIGWVVKDIDKTSQSFADLFGMEKPNIVITDGYSKTNAHYNGKPTEARAKLAFIRMNNITIELIEPVGKPSTWQQYLDEHGEGIHHIAFRIKDMDKTIALLENQGGKLVQQGDFTGGSYAYVDMGKQLKTIIELLSSDDN